MSKKSSLEKELSNRPVLKDLRRQKLLNELMDQPEVIQALESIANKLPQAKTRTKFLPGRPERVEVQPKHRLRTDSQNTLRVEPEEKRTKEIRKKKFHKILNKLPHWMSQLQNSDERHRFALKCFSSIYEGGLWIERVGRNQWRCLESFGVNKQVQVDVVQQVAGSPFASAAMETLKVITAPRDFLPEVFAHRYPVHLFVIEKPTIEKRSFFCFFGIREYDDIQQFVIRSALYEFQKSS